MTAVDRALLVATFGERLRAAGVRTTPEHDARFAAALDTAWPSRIEQLYWLARITLVAERASIPTFDAVFDEVFRGYVDVADAVRNPDVPPAGASARREAARAQGDDRQDVVAAGGDERERLTTRSFGDCTNDELADLGRLIAALRITPPVRRSRRVRRHRRGQRVDWRATLRAARRTAGDPVRPVTRRRRVRPRRVVFVVDVSRSMERYSRAYLYVLHAAVRAVGAEAFVFSTRLTRLTRELAGTDSQEALDEAMGTAPDWAGGTRLGDALGAFVDGYGRRGLARGAVVVIVSDGWDAGDPAVVAHQMRQLALLAHHVVWVNPRLQSPRFEPRTGGMAAALPYIDELVSGHSLDAVEALLVAIGRATRTFPLPA